MFLSSNGWLGSCGGGCKLESRGGETSSAAFTTGRGGNGGGNLARSMLDPEWFIDIRRSPLAMLRRRLLGAGEGVMQGWEAE